MGDIAFFTLGFIMISMFTWAWIDNSKRSVWIAIGVVSFLLFVAAIGWCIYLILLYDLI